MITPWGTMGLLGLSKSDIRACLDVLETARTFSDANMRRDHAQRVVPMLERMRCNKALITQIGTLIDQDQMDRAVQLLGAHQQRKSPLRMGCLGVIIPLLAGLVFFFVGPILSGDRPVAMQVLNDCRAAQRALGTPIEVNRLGIPLGDGAINSRSGMARRSLPVTGSDGWGRYHYFAEKPGDQWVIQHGMLEMEGQHLLVVPCVGLVSQSDAEGRLQSGFQDSGPIRDVKGSPPVQRDATCSVTVHRDPDYPDGVPYNCRVVVTCDGKTLYGASEDTGYVFCHVRDGAPTTAVDAIGSNSAPEGDSADPMLRMDLPAHEVQVSDDDGWSFTIDLQGSN